MSDDWRVDSHDKEIKELRDKLREAKTEVWNDIREAKEELRKELGKELQKANDKILALEDRPYEWFVKVMPVIIGIMAGAYIALLIAGVIHKH